MKMEDSSKEFEHWQQELIKAHWCEKCHGKIVCIAIDNLGNTKCAYCERIVKYPKIKIKVFEKMVKEKTNEINFIK